MKRFLFLFLSAALIVSLAACGGAVVDYDTPKSGELSAAYDFYRDSQASLASGMSITPEQADDGHCTITSGFSTFDVYYTNGVVDRVDKGGETL